jgi:tetratricopeptide repeat protein 21B
MKSFNRARQDSELGITATYRMIEICINPDNETIGGETFESMDVQLRLSQNLQKIFININL